MATSELDQLTNTLEQVLNNVKRAINEAKVANGSIIIGSKTVKDILDDLEITITIALQNTMQDLYYIYKLLEVNQFVASHPDLVTYDVLNDTDVSLQVINDKQLSYIIKEMKKINKSLTITADITDSGIKYTVHVL